MKYNNNETNNKNEDKLFFKKNSSLNKIIINHDINNNLYNIKNRINIFCILKIRKKILLILVLSIIIGLIIFLILYYKKINKKTIISFNPYLNKADDKEGFYVPKDNLLIYKRCSIENCKNCYGNTYNNTCISCKKSYDSIKDENNKIISCKYNPQKEEEQKQTTILEEQTSNLINCDPGYYLPEGNNLENKCKKCSLFGCEICHGDESINYCDSCFSKYILHYIDINSFICVECENNCLECDQITSKCLKCEDEYLLF